MFQIEKKHYLNQLCTLAFLWLLWLQITAVLCPQSGRADWVLVAVGDVSAGGTAAPELAARGYSYPFTKTADLLRTGQVVFGNLEGSVSRRGQPWPEKQYRFRMSPEFVPALAAAGFTHLSLANNHILDYGYEALADTIQTLRQNGVQGCGAGGDLASALLPATTVVDGIEIDFICFSNTLPEQFYATASSPGTAYGDLQTVRRAVSAAVARGAVVLVSFHWGTELMLTPREYQRELAHAAIDAGAAAVLGHHPHILQPVEQYRQRPIVYSMGNFSFGSFSRNVSDGALFRLIFSGPRVTRIEVIPLDVFNPRVVFVPTPVAGAEARRIIDPLRAASRAYGAAGTTEADRLVFHFKKDE